MKLFDQKERKLSGPSTYSADEYEYFNESNRPEIDLVRQLLEGWFFDYPDTEKEDLKVSFKATFPHAFSEIFIYQLFKKLGYCLQVHPDMADTKTHPDFLATKGAERLYLEVRHLDLMSDKEKSAHKRINTLCDVINSTVDPSDFYIFIRGILLKDEKQPSGRSVARAVNQKLASLNPDQHLEELKRVGLIDMPEQIFEDDRILIRYVAIAKPKDRRGIKTRPIGGIGSDVVFGDDSDSFRDAIIRKAGKYGQFGAPYIICLNKQTPGLNMLELPISLYGNIVATYNQNTSNKDHRLEFDFSGVFASPAHARWTRVSAVYLTNANATNLAKTAEQMLRMHHSPQFPISDELANIINKTVIRDLLNIDPEYPFLQMNR